MRLYIYLRVGAGRCTSTNQIQGEAVGLDKLTALSFFNLITALVRRALCWNILFSLPLCTLQLTDIILRIILFLCVIRCVLVSYTFNP